MIPDAFKKSHNSLGLILRKQYKTSLNETFNAEKSVPGDTKMTPKKKLFWSLG